MSKRNAKKKSVKSTEEDEEIEMEEKKDDFVDEEVERQIVAIRAIRDVEIEHTLTALRLLRSYFTEEKLQSSVLEFFKDNLPGLSLSKNEENGEIELKRNDENGDADGGVEDLNYSILKQLSMGFPDLFTRQSLGGYDLPDNVRANLLGTYNSHLENLASQGLSENQMLASHDALRTPEVNGQRLSFGVTPKTRRLPKPGEMIVSVHGSPLGVYKEEHNMRAINEEDS